MSMDIIDYTKSKKELNNFIRNYNDKIELKEKNKKIITRRPELKLKIENN